MENNKTADTSQASIVEWFQKGIRAFKKPDGVAAVKAFRKVIALDPFYRHTDGDNAFFYLGKIMEVEGDLNEAITMYTRAISLDSLDEESLIGRGSCYTVLNQPNNAIADFKKILSIGSQRRRVPLEQIYYVIGENYRKQGQWSQAWEWGKRAQTETTNSDRINQLVEEATAWLEK